MPSRCHGELFGVGKNSHIFGDQKYPCRAFRVGSKGDKGKKNTEERHIEELGFLCTEEKRTV